MPRQFSKPHPCGRAGSAWRGCPYRLGVEQDDATTTTAAAAIAWVGWATAAVATGNVGEGHGLNGKVPMAGRGYTARHHRGGVQGARTVSRRCKETVGCQSTLCTSAIVFM